jgi:pimeloyl-ACP methyl ester carboxylesterase
MMWSASGTEMRLQPAAHHRFCFILRRRWRHRCRRRWVVVAQYDPAMRLVLLHALPLDGRMWDATGTRFGGAFAPTLYGLGESVRDWAVAVLEHCGGDELLVVGNSVGCSCALEVARAAPGQVRGVVLVGAKPGCRPDDWCAGVLRPARSRRVSRVLEWCGSCRRETPKRTPTCRRCFVASRPR